jgi:hypothetical protein
VGNVVFIPAAHIMDMNALSGFHFLKRYGTPLGAYLVVIHGMQAEMIPCQISKSKEW